MEAKQLKIIFTSFWSLWHTECNVAIDNTINIPKICLYIVYIFLDIV